MTNDDNDNMIELACRSFEKSVEKFIQQTVKRIGLGLDDHLNTKNGRSGSITKCKQLVRHGNHVLRTLTAKRTSLRHAITAFKECSRHHVQQFATTLKDKEDDGREGEVEEHQQRQRQRRREHILRKWFANYLRLRDGFVLLESGECRHAHDGDDSNGNDNDQTFRSHLSDALRRDGKTRKFSSKRGYSGAGYDEVYDEDVGIKTHLLDTLVDMSCNNTLDRDAVWEKLLRKGAEVWESQFDEHIDLSKELRNDLNRIQENFVNDINVHLATARKKKKKGGTPDKVKLKLVTDDKSERITLGLVDIARQGNAFTISDAGGSLPFNMTVKGWRKKFELGQQLQSSQQQQQRPRAETAKSRKNKRVILEDSDESSDDGNTTTTYKKTPSVQESKKRSLKRPREENNDGLAVRVRQATDVSNNTNSNNNKKTTSIDEMKRQLGVNNAQLEQSREQVEEENLRSKMAADDEDMQQDMLGDNNGGDGNDNNTAVSSTHALLKACLSSRTELRKNDAYDNDTELLWKAQEYWEDFDESLVRWKENFQELLQMRKDVSGGSLEESSDHAYMLRERFREANMQLGNECMDVVEFFSSQLEKHRQTARGRSPASAAAAISSLEDSLSKICRSYLQFAQETFKTALNMVSEQERCQAKTPATIQKHWEKGQHLLLRGRAHHNIGRATYELAQYHDKLPKQQQQQLSLKQKRKDLLVKARKESDSAMLRAKSLRHNTVVINGHANAKDASTQNRQFTWAVEATVHLLEAMKLESLSSGLHIACSWKLDDARAAEERFDQFFESMEVTDLLRLAGDKGASHLEVAEVLEDMYLLSMKVAESSARSMEEMSKRKGWNALEGEKLLRITRKAMKRAASVSDRLLSFVDQNALDYQKERVATRVMIEREEGEICKWWEDTKARAQRKFSDVVGARAHVDLPRTEVAGDVDMTTRAVQLPRRIFIHDGRSLQGRSFSGRARSVKRANPDTGTVTDRFGSEFGSSGTNTDTGDHTEPVATGQNNAPTTYRKWGNEVLAEHERRRCCPPLPDGLPIEVRRALENKLGDILPTSNQLLGV